MEETTLLIRFTNTKAVELNQFTLSLNALALQYESFLKENYPSSYTGEERKLYIRKVDQGSIIVELAGMILPLIQDANTIIEFFNYIKCSIEFFLGKINSTKNYSNADLNQFNSFLNPIACDQGATMYCSTKSGDIVNNTYNISYLDSNVAQNRINKMLESRFQEKQVDTTFYEKMCFQWAITSFKQNKKVIDKIIIDNISRKPLKVLFINESDKISATTNNLAFPENNWQDLIYVADVEVCCTAGHLRAYKIMKLYTEETFVTEDVDDYSL